MLLGLFGLLGRAASFAAFLGLAFPAVAADQSLSSMPSAGTFGGTEIFYTVQGGDKKASLTLWPPYIFGFVSGDCTATSGGALTCLKSGGATLGPLATATVPISVPQGGTGTTTPALVGGTGISLSGTWPNQTITSVGGITAGPNCTVTGTWPNQTVNCTCSGGGGGSTTLAGLTDVSITPGVVIDSNVLYYNSVSAKWQALATVPGYQANNWYLLQGLVKTAGSAVTTNQGFCFAGYLPQTATIGSLGINVTGAGSSSFQLAMYQNKGGNCPTNRPGALIDATASIANTGTGFKSAAFSGGNHQLMPGTYWLCTNSNDSLMIATSIDLNGTGNAVIGSSNGVDLLSTGVNGVYTALAYGSWGANLFGAPWTVNTTTAIPLVELFVVSAP